MDAEEGGMECWKSVKLLEERAQSMEIEVCVAKLGQDPEEQNWGNLLLKEEGFQMGAKVGHNICGAGPGETDVGAAEDPSGRRRLETQVLFGRRRMGASASRPLLSKPRSGNSSTKGHYSV